MLFLPVQVADGGKELNLSPENFLGYRNSRAKLLLEREVRVLIRGS